RSGFFDRNASGRADCLKRRSHSHRDTEMQSSGNSSSELSVCFHQKIKSADSTVGPSAWLCLNSWLHMVAAFNAVFVVGNRRQYRGLLSKTSRWRTRQELDYERSRHAPSCSL